MSENEQQFLTIAELAELLRISIITARRLHADGQLPAAIRVGRQLRFRQQDIEKWIHDMQQADYQ